MKKKILIFVGLCLCISFSGCSMKSKLKYQTANDIFIEMRKYDDFDYFITSSRNYTVNTDPEGVLGNTYAYTSKVSWAVEKLNENDFDEDYFENEDFGKEYYDDEYYNGGTIEVYRNEKDAKMRRDFLEYCTKRIDESFTTYVYGKLAKPMKRSNKYVHQNGNVIIYVWREIDEGFPKSWFKELDETLNRMKFEQEDVPTDKEITKELNRITKEFDESLIATKKEYNTKLDNEASKVDEKINLIEQGASRETVRDVMRYIDGSFSSKYYDSKRNEWYARMRNINGSDTNSNKIILKSGRYVVGEDIAGGNYIVTSNMGSVRLSIETDDFSQRYDFDHSVNLNLCNLKHEIDLEKSSILNVSYLGGERKEEYELTFTPYGEVPPATACD